MPLRDVEQSSCLSSPCHPDLGQLGAQPVFFCPEPPLFLPCLLTSVSRPVRFILFYHYFEFDLLTAIQKTLLRVRPFERN